MAGRTLTEAQKIERAARKLEKKHREELGPLFEQQAPTVDRDKLQQEYRWGNAKSVEHMATIHHPAVHGLEMMRAKGLERLARRHMPSGDVDRLAAYIYRVYPCEAYWTSAWLEVLSGAKQVATAHRLCFDPARVNENNADGRHLVREGVLPREGFVPPLTPEQARAWHWSLCKACGLYHGPGQAGCLAAPVADPEEADREAEAVLALIGRRAA